MLWRKPGISRAVFEPQFNGADRPVFTEVIWAGTSRSLVALLRPWEG